MLEAGEAPPATSLPLLSAGPAATFTFLRAGTAPLAWTASGALEVPAPAAPTPPSLAFGFSTGADASSTKLSLSSSSDSPLMLLLLLKPEPAESSPSSLMLSASLSRTFCPDASDFQRGSQQYPPPRQQFGLLRDRARIARLLARYAQLVPRDDAYCSVPCASRSALNNAINS